MSSADRLARLKKARAAAIAVQEEMERRNDNDPTPANVLKRAPILRRADQDVTDLDLLINDLEGDMQPIALDADEVDKLDRLAARLNDVIARDALVGIALETVTRVLETAAEVKTALA